MDVETAESELWRPLFVNHVELGPLFKIHLTNLLLTIITLGFFRFWAKTRIRRYLWSHIEIEGDRLEYTGTAMELFRGFLIVFFLVILPFLVAPQVAVVFAFPGDPALSDTVSTFQAIAVFLLLPLAIYLARRYRLSRTLWRGIRGHQAGSGFTYAGLSLLAKVGNFATLGFLMPITQTSLAQYRVRNTWFGTQNLDFTARGSNLYGAYFATLGLYLIVFVMIVAVSAAWFAPALSAAASNGDWTPSEAITYDSKLALVWQIAIAVVVLILIRVPGNWYRGSELRYFAGVTGFQNLRFDMVMSRWAYVWLMVSNAVIVLVSLTVLSPVAYLRAIRFAERSLFMAGTLVPAEIHQSPDQGPRRGEGLADAFDVGGF